MPAEYEPSNANRKDSQESLEHKYLANIADEYDKTLATFSSEKKVEKEHLITDIFSKLKEKLSGQPDTTFGPRQEAILKLKLARYLQRKDSIDTNSLFDAIVESPGFINKDKGSFHRLFELHEEKTLLKIAEMRKKRAEVGSGEGSNPWENLFTTTSGKYYVARLLNMPHLEKESEYMNHCVGISDSYVNKIKRGEIEILSFRSVPKRDPKTGQMLGDFPIMTIEYNLKTKIIEQMKLRDDELLDKDNTYYADIIDALTHLRKTKTDKGELRDFRSIDPNELVNIHLAYDEILTDRGIVTLQDFNPDSESFVIKIGFLGVDSHRPKEDAVKIIRIVEDIKCAPEELAYSREEITDKTKVYIGALFPGIFQLPIENIYTSFPEKKINRYEIKIGVRTKDEIKLALKTEKIKTSAPDLLESSDFIISPHVEEVKLIRLTVGDLGFSLNTTTEKIYAKAEEYDLELCPPEVGPELHLSYRGKGWMVIAMKQINVPDVGPCVFRLAPYGDDLWLVADPADPPHGWGVDTPFLFRLRKKT